MDLLQEYINSSSDESDNNTALLYLYLSLSSNSSYCSVNVSGFSNEENVSTAISSLGNDIMSSSDIMNFTGLSSIAMPTSVGLVMKKTMSQLPYPVWVMI